MEFTPSRSPGRKEALYCGADSGRRRERVRVAGGTVEQSSNGDNAGFDPATGTGQGSCADDHGGLRQAGRGVGDSDLGTGPQVPLSGAVPPVGAQAERIHERLAVAVLVGGGRNSSTRHGRGAALQELVNNRQGKAVAYGEPTEPH